MGLEATPELQSRRVPAPSALFLMSDRLTSDTQCVKQKSGVTEIRAYGNRHWTTLPARSIFGPASPWPVFPRWSSPWPRLRHQRMILPPEGAMAKVSPQKRCNHTFRRSLVMDSNRETGNWSVVVARQSLNQCPVRRDPAYDDGDSGMRVKPRAETLAPRWFGRSGVGTLLEGRNPGILPNFHSAGR
jgi:hypothetical protein